MAFEKSESVFLKGSDELKLAQDCTVSLQGEQRTAVAGAVMFLLESRNKLFVYVIGRQEPVQKWHRTLPGTQSKHRNAGPRNGQRDAGVAFTKLLLEK